MGTVTEDLCHKAEDDDANHDRQYDTNNARTHAGGHNIFDSGGESVGPAECASELHPLAASLVEEVVHALRLHGFHHCRPSGASRAPTVYANFDVSPIDLLRFGLVTNRE